MDMKALVALLGEWAAAFSGWVWSLPLFFLLLGCGLLFSIVTKFVQWRILVHGYACIRGKYDNPDDAGHVNHFQALSAALSGTIGLGNIAGVAVAVSLGGPGAVFWMWIVGLFGMALKFMECSLAVMFRDTRGRDGNPVPEDAPFDPENHEVHGGPMWYIQKAFVEPIRKINNPAWMVFKVLAVVFALATAISALGQGNMFQGWNVAEVLKTNFAVPRWASASVLAVMVAIVIIGGIRRIGEVASRLVPFMCVVYVLGALWVVIVHASEVPYYLSMIVRSAFTGTAETGAFAGVTVWVAFQWGLKRALFSNEAGQGSAAMAHAAARTAEPIREGVVAGIGPFVDTLIICTMSALVLLMTGTWDRPPVGTVTAIDGDRAVVQVNHDVPENFRGLYADRVNVSTDHVNYYLLVYAPHGADTGLQATKLPVIDITRTGDNPQTWADYATVTLDLHGLKPEQRAALQAGQAAHLNLEGAEMMRFAFDTTIRGFGVYMVTLGVCLFAFSTMITWSYYGERGAEYLLGRRVVLPYKIVFVCFVVIGMLLDRFDVVYDFSDGLAGVMALCNLPALLLLSPTVLRAARSYFRRLDSGEMQPVQRPRDV